MGKFEELEGKFVFDTDRHVSDTVVKVVTFTVALDHVSELRVIDVMHLEAHQDKAGLKTERKIPVLWYLV